MSTALVYHLLMMINNIDFIKKLKYVQMTKELLNYKAVQIACKQTLFAIAADIVIIMNSSAFALVWLHTHMMLLHNTVIFGWVSIFMFHYNKHK